jgi:hypothetical protein
MSQGIFDNIVPTTTSGNELATLLNNFRDAVISGFSGTSRPSQLAAGGYWIDTTNDPTSWDFKIYTGSSDITIFTLNLSTGVASISNADTLFQVSKISNDAVGPIIRLLKKRISGGGQTKDGDTVGEVQFYATRDSGATTLQARIRAISSDDVTASAQGAYMVFEVTTDGASSISEVMRVIDGRVGIGTTAPQNALHVVGNGARAEKNSDDAVGIKLILKKTRIAGVGQVQSGDVIGEMDFYSKDNAGTEITDAAKIEVSATENHTSTAHGSKISFKTKKIGQTSTTTHLEIGENVNVKTNLVVDGTLTVSGTTTTVNSTTLDVADSNISVNKGGNQSAANLNKAGLKVEMSDATFAQIGYDSTKASKFVIGNVGSESEVITATHTQTMTNKTLTSPTINNPARAGVKEDTEANLTTYAATATNGQWCFATDTKVMYQVIDNALVPAGSGGGGISLNWVDGDVAPAYQLVYGTSLGKFDNLSSQEVYAVLTVPQSYRAGKQIKLKSGQFYSDITSGNVLFKATTALVKSGHVLGTYSDTRNSTNAQVAVAGVANTITSIGDIDLTDSSGQINGQAVQAGHKLRIRLFRDNASETSAAAGEAKLIMDSFEPTFS